MQVHAASHAPPAMAAAMELWRLSRQAVRQIRERRMQPLCCIHEQVLQGSAFAPSLGLLQMQHLLKCLCRGAQGR